MQEPNSKPTPNLKPVKSSCAMGMGIPLLDVLRRDAIAFSSAFKPWGQLRGLILVYDDEQVPLAVPPMGMIQQHTPSAPSMDPGDFDPTPLQMRMIQFLAAGPKSPTQMKNHTHGHMYDSPGGINDLLELGIIEKKFSKLRLTEVGQGIAAEIGDEDVDDVDP